MRERRRIAGSIPRASVGLDAAGRSGTTCAASFSEDRERAHRPGESVQVQAEQSWHVARKEQKQSPRA